MRTAIVLGAVLIAQAIRPDMVLPDTLAWFLIVSIVVMVIFDIVDFFTIRRNP